LQQVVHLHQQWPLEVAQEVEQGELAAAASAAYRAEAGQYLFPSPEKAARHLYHHQERPHALRLGLIVRPQLLFSSGA
jgi:hypothetical protein